MSKNKLIIAAAGSGKTTYIINNALEIKDKNVLITTYTEANSEEIRKKVLDRCGYLPKNITIQTWFSFLLQHGVRPYQSSMNVELHDRRINFYLSERGSTTSYKGRDGKTYSWSKDKNFYQYYFLSKNNLKICSDTIADFIVTANKTTKGEVIDRISRIYPYIFIDEVQDFAGWELEIIKLLFESKSEVLLVGDPRQVTYLTHHSTKYRKYRDGKIQDFIKDKCKKDTYEIDTTTLKDTHRNNKAICDFSSQLFPDYEKCEPCSCDNCRNYIQESEGIFIVRNDYIDNYCDRFKPTILRWSGAVHPDWNFGKSKGLTFDRVLIYPTTSGKSSMLRWLKDSSTKLSNEARSKLYVAITRARYSVAFVHDCNSSDALNNIIIYEPDQN